MKELEEKASDLLQTFEDLYYNTIDDNTDGVNARILATQCAIQSVNHTIETLQKLIDKIDIDVNSYLSTHDALKEQIQLKKILEGRL